MKSAKAVTMFKGIKNLVSSGPGTTKTPDVHKLRPEGAVHIDAGNLKARSGMKNSAAGSPKKVTMSGHKGIHVGVRPEPSVKRDAAKVVKPF
jgi:hypothetical protein